MIQYYTALGRYELRTNDRGEKHPVLISSRQEYAPDLCEMLLWSSLLWHIRDQKNWKTSLPAARKTCTFVTTTHWLTTAPAWNASVFCAGAAGTPQWMPCLN